MKNKIISTHFGTAHYEGNLAIANSPSIGTPNYSNVETYQQRVQENFPNALLVDVNGFYEVQTNNILIAGEIMPPKTTDAEKAWFYAQQAIEFDSIVDRLKRDIELNRDIAFEYPEHAVNTYSY